MKKISIESFKALFEKKGYYFEDSNRIQLIGIRSQETQANSFDDSFYLIYPDEDNHRKVEAFPITTDPGKYWLENPINAKGTAILVPNQYKNTYTIGLHGGKYKALVQQQPVKVWRDNTKDTVLDSFGEIYEGFFGINIHRSNAKSESFQVDKWSAGCQVFKKVKDFNFLMETCEKSNQKEFTYTLLEERDFEEIPKESIALDKQNKDETQIKSSTPRLFGFLKMFFNFWK